MEAVVTLVESSTKTGQSPRGPWTMFVFKDTSGITFQTFDTGLGQRIQSQLMQQPLRVSYNLEQRGDYQNNVIQTVELAGPTLQAPAAPQQQVAAQTYSPAPPLPAPANDYELRRQLQIMRQSALERAIRTAQAGLCNISNRSELYALADEYVRYFIQGSQSTQTAASASPPSPSAAPVAAGASSAPAATAPQRGIVQPQNLTAGSDDIPYLPV